MTTEIQNAHELGVLSSRFLEQTKVFLTLLVLLTYLLEEEII